ncbi:MAG: hypothetical protein LQ345_003621, partial [Seirophora villosa]
ATDLVLYNDVISVPRDCARILDSAVCYDYSLSNALGPGSIAQVRGAESRKLEPSRDEEGANGLEAGEAVKAGHQRMPGLLKTEGDDRAGQMLPQASVVKSANMAGDINGSHEHDPQQRNHRPLANGLPNVPPTQQVNGDITAAESSPAKLSAIMGDLVGQLPPEIEHITFGYLPFSELITRLVQETFNGLTDSINEMSELQVPHVNGATPADTSQVSVRKRLRLLNFAQARRAQFIKILVLSQWSRQAQSISRVIDMRIWLDGKKRLYDDACNWMGELKRILESERMPNPDLRTALEALSLGKTAGLTDLGYLPPNHLSPQRLLKAIRGINTQLSLRLYLHENVPPAFRNFSVANGRVTFRVPSAFEVDLSIANDDLSSQMYFIDFRFDFEPTPAELPLGQLRNEIENKVNELLRRDGLGGCYRFLHSFVLTHKLNIFRHQAYRLAQAKWTENLNIEAVHRSLVVQYWIGRPGGKNWIEIGIRRRNVGNSSWFHQEEDEPHIGLRWFRAGKEVSDVPVAVNLRKLSIETILKQIVAAHTDAIIRGTSAKLEECLLYSKNILTLKHVRSRTEPTSHLLIQLTASQSCSIMQEPVTGNFALLPPSSLNSRGERELNGLGAPEKDAASRIAQLRAIASCDEVERTVRCYGWEVVRSLRPSLEVLRQYFGPDTARSSFFRKRAWNARWLLAFTASLVGDFWWIVELNQRSSKPDPLTAPGTSIREAFKLPMKGYFVAASTELSLSDLTQIERIAAGLISQFIDTRELSAQCIPHRFVRANAGRSRPELPTLYVHFTGNRAQRFQKDPDPYQVPWSSQNVRASFVGVDPSKSTAHHLILAQRNSAALRSRRLNIMVGELIKVHPNSSAFAFPLSNPVGQSTVPAILERLARIQRLMDYVRTLQAFKLEPQNLSLDHFEFAYSTQPHVCRAEISFTGVEDSPQLSLNRGNPHLRVQDHLISLFRKSNGLNRVIWFLQLSLPLMQAFAAIEAANTKNTAVVLPRCAEWYQIRYRDPPGRFDVRLRRRRDELKWFVQHSSLSAKGGLDQRLQDQLDSLWKGKGEGWHGVHQGIVASVDGVHAGLQKIDEIFSQHIAPPPAQPRLMAGRAETGKKQDFKGQKRKAEDDGDVVVLD